jgi:hypothetical protein
MLGLLAVLFFARPAHAQHHQPVEPAPLQRKVL